VAAKAHVWVRRESGDAGPPSAVGLFVGLNDDCSASQFGRLAGKTCGSKKGDISLRAFSPGRAQSISGIGLPALTSDPEHPSRCRRRWGSQLVQLGRLLGGVGPRAFRANLEDWEYLPSSTMLGGQRGGPRPSGSASTFRG
jgi:hypothetical protein